MMVNYWFQHGCKQPSTRSSTIKKYIFHPDSENLLLYENISLVHENTTRVKIKSYGQLKSKIFYFNKLF